MENIKDNDTNQSERTNLDPLFLVASLMDRYFKVITNEDTRQIFLEYKEEPRGFKCAECGLKYNCGEEQPERDMASDNDSSLCRWCGKDDGYENENKETN